MFIGLIYQYDGDSSCCRYNCTLPALISDWRSQWHESTAGETDVEFPFGIVQLNSIGNGTIHPNIYIIFLLTDTTEVNRGW